LVARIPKKRPQPGTKKSYEQKKLKIGGEFLGGADEIDKGGRGKQKTIVVVGKGGVRKQN